MTAHNTCLTCRYAEWQFMKADQYMRSQRKTSPCHKNPPVVVRVVGHDDRGYERDVGGSLLPTVSRDNWCGEHEEATDE